jgi:hypothetical protein
MLENALRSLSLFNLFVSWHFNITTLTNPSGESFEPRHEQDYFSYEKQSRAQTLWKGIYCSKSNNSWGANAPEMKIFV